MYRVLVITIAFVLSAMAFADEDKVYTNADLERMFGKTERPVAKVEPTDQKAPIALPDPLTWLNQRLKAEKEHRLAIAAGEKRVDAAQKLVDGLEIEMIELRHAAALHHDPTYRYQNRKPGTERRLYRMQAYKAAEQKLLAAQEALTVAKKELAELRRNPPHGPN